MELFVDAFIKYFNSYSLNIFLIVISNIFIEKTKIVFIIIQIQSTNLLNLPTHEPPQQFNVPQEKKNDENFQIRSFYK